MKTAILIFSALAIAGCVSPEQQRQRIADACTSYGFAEGSPEMAQCMQAETLALRERQQRAAASLQNISQQYQPQTTTCRNLGGMVSCSTY